MADEKAIASSVGTSTASESRLERNVAVEFEVEDKKDEPMEEEFEFEFVDAFVEEEKKDEPMEEVSEHPGAAEAMADEKVITSSEGSHVASTAALKRVARLYPPRVLVWRLMGPLRRSKQPRLKSNVAVEPKEEESEQPESVDANVEEEDKKEEPKEKESEQPESVDAFVEEEEKKNEPKEEISGSADANAEPMEDKNKAEKLTNGVFGEPTAGVSPWVASWWVARGSEPEQVEIQVPNEKVDLINGLDGETIRNMQLRSETLIELTQPNPSDGEQSKEWIVRISGEKKQIEIATEMIKDVMNQTVWQPPPHTRGNIQHQGHLLCGGSHHSQHPPSSSQSYSHGYNEAQYDVHAPPQHFGPQPTPYAQGGSTTHSGYGPPQDEYGKPPPMYNMQQPQGPPPHAQPYGQQPRPNQPIEADPCQVPAQMYGQSMPPPQQKCPYAPSAPVQQTYPNPPYGSAPASGGQTYPNNPPAAPSFGYGQPVAGSQQPQAYPLAPQPTANNAAANGYQVPVNPAAYGAPPQQAPPEAYQAPVFQAAYGAPPQQGPPAFYRWYQAHVFVFFPAAYGAPPQQGPPAAYGYQATVNPAAYSAPPQQGPPAAYGYQMPVNPAAYGAPTQQGPPAPYGWYQVPVFPAACGAPPQQGPPAAFGYQVPVFPAACGAQPQQGPPAAFGYQAPVFPAAYGAPH